VALVLEFGGSVILLFWCFCGLWWLCWFCWATCVDGGFGLMVNLIWIF